MSPDYLDRRADHAPPPSSALWTERPSEHRAGAAASFGAIFFLCQLAVAAAVAADDERWADGMKEAASTARVSREILRNKIAIK